MGISGETYSEGRYSSLLVFLPLVPVQFDGSRPIPGVVIVEIALEQSQGCVKSTTETTWHVMLVLL